MAHRLTQQQAGRLHQRVGPLLTYLGKARRRLELVGVALDDPLYLATVAAFNATHDLFVRSHYASCAGGVAMEPVPDERAGQLDTPAARCRSTRPDRQAAAHQGEEGRRGAAPAREQGVSK